MSEENTKQASTDILPLLPDVTLGIIMEYMSDQTEVFCSQIEGAWGYAEYGKGDPSTIPYDETDDILERTGRILDILEEIETENPGTALRIVVSGAAIYTYMRRVIVYFLDVAYQTSASTTDKTELQVILPMFKCAVKWHLLFRDLHRYIYKIPNKNQLLKADEILECITTNIALRNVATTYYLHMGSSSVAMTPADHCKELETLECKWAYPCGLDDDRKPNDFLIMFAENGVFNIMKARPFGCRHSTEDAAVIHFDRYAWFALMLRHLRGLYDIKDRQMLGEMLQKDYVYGLLNNLDLQEKKETIEDLIHAFKDETGIDPMQIQIYWRKRLTHTTFDIMKEMREASEKANSTNDKRSTAVPDMQNPHKKMRPLQCLRCGLLHVPNNGPV